MSQTNHLHTVTDADPHFIINAKTRKIEQVTEQKIVLMQGDHNSEVITFELPRYIEGHDMLQCNQVRVLFGNIEYDVVLPTGNSCSGVNEITDLHENSSDYTSLLCGWAISHNATRYRGVLNFVLQFECVDGVEITYAWHTDIYKSLTVKESIPTDNVFSGDNLDLINQWKVKMLNELGSMITSELAKHVSLGKISDNNLKVTKLVTDMDILEARLANYMGSSESTIPDNAELLDIRVSADGTTYASAGEAVREQVRALRTTQVNPNLLDMTTLVARYISNENVLQYDIANAVFTSDYIPVDSDYTYHWHIDHYLDYGTPWFAVATYDANMAFIARYTWSETDVSITLNSNVKYIRVSFRSFMLFKAKLEQSTFATPYVDEDVHDNIAEMYPLCVPGYITADNGGYGEPTSLGQYVPDVIMDERSSVFIPVQAGDTYVIYNGATVRPWLAFGFYDAEGNFLGRTVYSNDISYNGGVYNRVTGKPIEFVVPENAIAMVYSARTYSQHTFICYKKTGYNNYLDEYLKLITASGTPTEVSSYNVKSIAHRGYSIEAPENTISAYRLAAQKGFGYVECDVSFTSDGIPVLLHDGTIDRTSNGTGSISGMTYAAVREFDFGSWFGVDYTGEKIPSLAEFISLCKSLALHPYIEIKSGTDENVASIVSVVKQYGMTGKVTYISFSDQCLQAVKNIDPDARLGLVVSSITSDTITTAEGLKTETNEVFIDSGAGATTAEMVTLCSDADIPLELWTVNDSSWIINSMNQYVSGVTSDSVHAGKVLYDANK